MILINLLPHREEKRRLRKQSFFVALGISALAGAGVVALAYVALQQMTAAQASRNQFLGAEIGRLDAQVKDIANLRAEIDALKARQKSVEDLQLERNLPVHLLEDLARQTPEGVYLTRIRQNGLVVEVNGVAQTNERVSEMLRNTAGAAWLERPELIEIKAANVSTGREQRRLYEFQMKVTLKRPASSASPASAPASAPAKASS